MHAEKPGRRPESVVVLRQKLLECGGKQRATPLPDKKELAAKERIPVKQGFTGQEERKKENPDDSIISPEPDSSGRSKKPSPGEPRVHGAGKKKGKGCLIVASLIVAGVIGAIYYSSVDVANRLTHLLSAPSSRSGPQEGRKWTAQLGSGVEMEFMPIAAGSFQMGSNNGGSDEKPVHTVRISKPFWLAKTEVTQQQYKQVMGKNPAQFQGLENPVEKVSWNDAVNFCKKLTEIERRAGRLPEGFEYTLPTEAQWEYARRAGMTSDYAGIGSPYLMGWDSSISGGKTHPVGTKQPNAWGLYDMRGNVWEWCNDWYDSGTYKSGTVTDPRGASSGSSRVLRGGSFCFTVMECMPAYRLARPPDNTLDDNGFRVCLAQIHSQTPKKPAGSFRSSETYTEKSTAINLNKGLVAHYPFDGNADEVTGNSNDGTVSGATLTTGVLGRPNSAYRFGSNKSIKASRSNAIEPRYNVSVSAWVRPDSLTFSYPDQRPILTKRLETAEGANSYILQMDDYNNSPGYVYFMINNQSENRAWASKPLVAGKWTHFTGTYDGANVKLYMNGTLVDTTPYSGKIAYSSLPLWIGVSGRHIQHQFWNGSIDDVRIYDRALSADEVRQLYAVERGESEDRESEVKPTSFLIK